MATTVAGFSDPNTISEGTWSQYWADTPMREQTIGFAVTRVALSLNLSIAGGQAWLGGVFYSTDAADSVTLAGNSSGSERFDLVVLEANWTTKTVSAAVVQGSPGGGVPLASRTAGTLWQAEVAVVRVPNGATEIQPADITQVNLGVVALYSIPTLSSLTDERLPPVSWKAAVHAQDTGQLYVSDGTAYQAVVPTDHSHAEYQTKIIAGTGTAPTTGVSDGDVYFRYV